MHTTGPRLPPKTRSEMKPAAKVPANPPSSHRKRQRADVAIGMPLASCR